jgi:hypothetical protein
LKPGMPAYLLGFAMGAIITRRGALSEPLESFPVLMDR